jgi:hypothetical protein
MADARNIDGSAFKNGSATFMARIVSATGDNITQNDISTVRYSIYLLDDQDPDLRTVVTGHDNAILSVATVLFTSLQTDTLWTVDTTGYNFRHILDVATYPAFSIAGRRYLVEYRLAPASGQVILVRFRIHVI